MKPVISATTPDDVRDFFPKASPWRIKAITGRVDGHIKGIGGVAFLPDGSRMVFLEASEEDCKRYPVTLHRAAKQFLSEMQGQGVSRVVARVDTRREAAVRWLERLGFECVWDSDGEVIYQWQNFSSRE